MTVNSSTKNPDVCVIVPVYKVEQYIRNCLDSLLNQTMANWEAILVDDGSPDNCGAICEEYAERDGRFKVIHKQNGGLSSARNAAIPLVSAEYVTFLDSDDFLDKNALIDLYKLARKHNADIVQCGFVRGAESKFPENTSDENIRIYDNHTIFTSFTAKIITCGKLYRTTIIEDIRFPEGLINEDDFTTWKFYVNASKIVVTTRPYYYYTVNPQSTMANQKRKPNLKYFDAYRERIAYFQKTGDKDLEAVSRIQWMKSLVMVTSNKALDLLQRHSVKKAFAENFKELYKSRQPIPAKLILIFRLYRITPVLISKIVNNLYRAK